ncbi:MULTISPECIES: antiviral reverse transcriptase Drt3a [unclassified Thioalkalivibrio]|uniref:antiviral reverse transcriptase Drt3a n=1 Tax=unclassified Thioalkalivibrio TaxID=2621013 RepID=UPI0012DE5FE7|nr:MULTISPECIES: antiviral reverse transcriptase Drt3a [unclassified Thioalkalivibrio]
MYWTQLIRRSIHDTLITSDHYKSGSIEEVITEHQADTLSATDPNLGPFEAKRASFNKKPGLQLTNPHEKIVDIATTQILRHELTIATTPRHQQIGQLIYSLRELGPATLYRFDVSAFFESFDRPALVDQVNRRLRASGPVKRSLSRYNRTCDANGIPGVARGIGMSSALTEYAMQDIDLYFLRDHETYFYGRFVDDIIIIRAKNKYSYPINETLQTLLDRVPGDLQINNNPEKHRAIDVNKTECPMREPFTYLGYTFTCRSDRSVSVDISPAKTKRIKSKIIRCFMEFKRNKNFNILKDSLKLLASNTALVRRGVKSQAMLTGIYYNYPHLTPDCYETGALPSIDAFLRSILYGTKTPLSRELRAHLSPEQRRQLLSISFTAGHKLRLFHRVSPSRARRLIEGWSHGT